MGRFCTPIFPDFTRVPNKSACEKHFFTNFINFYFDN